MSAEEKRRRDALIEKVRSLLDVAERGGSENERLQAAEMAQRLMLKHQIEAVALERDAGKQADFTEQGSGWLPPSEMWKVRFYAQIAEIDGVHAHLNTMRDEPYAIRLVFYGRAEKIDLVIRLGDSLVTWLESRCEQALQAQIASFFGVTEPALFRRSFYEGACNRIVRRLMAQRMVAEQDSGTGMDLVRLDADALKDAARDRYGDLTPEETDDEPVDLFAAAAGAAAGSQAPLNPGHELANDSSAHAG